MNTSSDKQIYRQFAQLLSYPGADLPQVAQQCLGSLTDVSSDVTDRIRRFVDFVQVTERKQIEETYTATFDLQPVCHPYIGYQLCGENQKRALMLMKLQELYRAENFVTNNELQDHVSEVLRFIGTTDNQKCRQEIIIDGLLPALEKIIQAIDNDHHPYQRLFKALHSFLSERSVEKGAVS